MEYMTEILRKRYALMAPKVIQALERRGFNGYFAKDRAEAKKMLLEMIPEGAVIGWGGSMTLDHMDVKDELLSDKYDTIDRTKAKTPEEKHSMEREILGRATHFLTSVNAMSEDGVLFNIDGVGNRVAATVFGPDKVIYLVGMNKISRTREDAYTRMRTLASPANCARLNKNTPCGLTGMCGDCQSDDCICSYIVETRHCMDKNRIHVILIGEDMGF